MELRAFFFTIFNTFHSPKRILCQKTFSEKLLVFLYSSMIKFCKTDKVKGIPLSKTFIENLKGIISNRTYIHHSHITSEIIGYAHSFCNAKVRENKYKITAIAHNLFSFDFFLLLKGSRAGVWRFRDIKIGGKNSTDISFPSIGNQILFP